MTASSGRPRRTDMRKDQLAALKPADDDDLAGHRFSGMRASSTLISFFSKSIISRCLRSASIPIMPVAAEVEFSQGRKLKVADVSARASAQRLDPIDDVPRRHSVEGRRRSERQLQVARDAQPDHRSIGAAVDDEAIGAGPVDLHVDAQPDLDLARLHVLAADRKVGVEIGRR